MKSERVTENLTRLTRLRFVNAYLVREDDGLTLVDTTLSGAADDLIAAAEAVNLPIRRIALTHGHGDHIGSLDALKEKLGGEVEVLMPERDRQVLDGQKEFEGRKVSGMWPKVSTRPDVALTGGERFGSLEVVPNPGHTPGHVAFLDTRDRTVIAGDTVATLTGVYVASHLRNAFPLPAIAAWDRSKVLESARALRALEPRVLVVGHGPAQRDPLVALDAAITTAERATKR